MRRQRSMSQMKNRTKEKLNKMEMSNLPDAKFKTLVVRMFGELRGRVDELSENFNKAAENIMETANIKKGPVRNEEYNN